MISPTIGRIVLYRPGGESGPSHAAIIVEVHSDRCVNLACFNDQGGSYPMTSVSLIHDGDDPFNYFEYCEWMPYQKGQAAKTEALEKELKT